MDVMTLDEAIKRAKELAEKEEKEARFYSVSRPDIYRKESCENRAAEHRQLAEWLKDYKRLLERESCEDAISREDALMALTGEWTEQTQVDEVIHRCIKRIRRLPSVNPQSDWIPISERLPEDTRYCLCCDKDGYMTIGSILKWSKEWCFVDEEIDINVVAWMPLPEPYKAESEDKE